jgi:hypothetical protein
MGRKVTEVTSITSRKVIRRFTDSLRVPFLVVARVKSVTIPAAEAY